MIRPHMALSFANILSHINTVFVLATKPGILSTVAYPNTLHQTKKNSTLHLQDSRQITRFGEQCDPVCNVSFRDKSVMRIKGQMIYLEESACIIFFCSPSVSSLDDLSQRGLYLSDIPLHDATRDLVFLSEKFHVEYKLAQKLEILTEELSRTYKEVEDEKKKTDR